MQHAPISRAATFLQEPAAWTLDKLLALTGQTETADVRQGPPEDKYVPIEVSEQGQNRPFVAAAGEA